MVESAPEVADMVFMGLPLAIPFFAAVVLAVPALAASAGSFVIAGRIPCMGQIAVVDDPGGAGAGNVAVARLTTDEYNRAFVTLRLRGNCPFTVSARLPDQGGQSVQIVSGSVTADGGTGHLTAQALHTIVKPVDIPGGFSAVCVEGPAISRGGNNLTPDNAVLVRIVMQFPQPFMRAAAEFSLVPGK